MTKAKIKDDPIWIAGRRFDYDHYPDDGTQRWLYKEKRQYREPVATLSHLNGTWEYDGIIFGVIFRVTAVGTAKTPEAAYEEAKRCAANKLEQRASEIRRL